MSVVLSSMTPSFLPLISIQLRMQLVFLKLIRRIVIHSVDSNIQHLNNGDQFIRTVLKLIDKVKTNKNYFTKNPRGGTRDFK